MEKFNRWALLSLCIPSCFYVFFIIYKLLKWCCEYDFTSSAHHPGLQVPESERTSLDGNWIRTGLKNAWMSCGRCILRAVENYGNAEMGTVPVYCPRYCPNPTNEDGCQQAESARRIPFPIVTFINEIQDKKRNKDYPPSYEEAMKSVVAASTDPSNDVVPPPAYNTLTGTTTGAALATVEEEEEEP